MEYDLTTSIFIVVYIEHVLLQANIPDSDATSLQRIYSHTPVHVYTDTVILNFSEGGVLYKFANIKFGNPSSECGLCSIIMNPECDL